MASSLKNIVMILLIVKNVKNIELLEGEIFTIIQVEPA